MFHCYVSTIYMGKCTHNNNNTLNLYDIYIEIYTPTPIILLEYIIRRSRHRSEL